VSEDYRNQPVQDDLDVVQTLLSFSQHETRWSSEHSSPHSYLPPSPPSSSGGVSPRYSPLEFDHEENHSQALHVPKKFHGESELARILRQPALQEPHSPYTPPRSPSPGLSQHTYGSRSSTPGSTASVPVSVIVKANGRPRTLAERKAYDFDVQNVPLLSSDSYRSGLGKGEKSCSSFCTTQDCRCDYRYDEDTKSFPSNWNSYDEDTKSIPSNLPSPSSSPVPHQVNIAQEQIFRYSKDTNHENNTTQKSSISDISYSVPSVNLGEVPTSQMPWVSQSPNVSQSLVIPQDSQAP